MSVVDLNEPVVRGWGDARSKSVGWHDSAILRRPPRDLSEFGSPTVAEHPTRPTRAVIARASARLVDAA
jgi:hypothetical protein